MIDCVKRLKMMMLSMASLSVLTACSEAFDLQGRDPQAFYAANPVVNKVESMHSITIVDFDLGSVKLNSESTNALTASLSGIKSNSVEDVEIRVPAGMASKNQRVASIKRHLSNAGIKAPVRVISQAGLTDAKVVVDISHLAVIAPRCPDWRKSPVTSYSNMTASNYGCAAAVNLGLMVANPRDLVQGRDSNVNNTERSAKVVSDYRAGVESTTTSLGGTN